MKAQGHPMNGGSSKLGKLSKFLPKRFMPSKKVPGTKGCHRVSVTRSPFNGAKYLCAALADGILVMEWFNPVSSFIEIKRMPVPEMPCPLLTFDLLIVKNRPLPLVCLGVYRHHSRRGREQQRYRLHLVDLNVPEGLDPTALGLDLITGDTMGLQSPASSSVPSSSAHCHQWDQSECIQARRNQTPTSASAARQSSPEQSSPELALDRKVTNCDLKRLEQRADYQRRNALFLPEDMLPVVEVVQLEHNAILVCLQDCAKVISLNGHIKSSRHRATTLGFNGILVESIVCLRDSILVFHPHGLLGKSFTGELTQEINDNQHIYRLLGCDRTSKPNNIIVESRSADDPMSNSNVYLLAGHTESSVM